MIHRPFKTVGLGAGGHASVICDIVDHLRDTFELVGFLDPAVKVLNGIPILGTDENLEDMRRRGVSHFFVGAGSTGSLAVRQRLFARGLAAGLVPATLVDPSAVISPRAILGPGVTIMPGAIINSGVVLGANCCINTGAIVEHGCRLHDHVFVGPGAVLGGAVAVGEGAFIGIGASVRQGIEIGPAALVGAGAVVVLNVPQGETVVGNPARKLLQ